MSRVLEDLCINNLKIYQDTSLYRFSSDSVLLSNYAKAKKGDSVVELCSGSGVISILLSQKTNASNYYLFEIDKDLSAMCEQSIKYNNLPNFVVYNKPISVAPQILSGKKVDVVVVNPPYYPKNQKNNGNFATHEIYTNLQEIADISSKLLKYGGKLYIVYPIDRFAELISTLTSAQLEPKHATLVSPKGKGFSVCLLTAQKNAKPGIKIDTLIT